MESSTPAALYGHCKNSSIMESYQRSFPLPTNTKSTKNDDDSTYTWSKVLRSIVVVGVIASIAVFAYSSSGATYHLSSLQRIQLAKSGRGHVRYSNLQTEEIKALFNEFKATYGKTVRLSSFYIIIFLDD